MLDNLSALDRWQGPTSPFFKPLVRIGFLLAAVAASVVAASDTLLAHNVPLPPLILKITEIIGYVSAAVALVSKLTVDREELAKQRALDGLGK